VKTWVAIALLAAPVAAADPPTARSQRDAIEHAEQVQHATPQLDGSLDVYIAYALSDSPAVRSAFARWQAAVHRIAPAGTLPNPTVSFGVFLRSVETRTGPQQARVSLQQSFPWPTALTASRSAAASEALASQHIFDAEVRAVVASVERAYWNLWELRTTRATHASHLDVLDGLSSTLGARLEVGSATLADLQQVDLSNARLADRIASMDANEGTLTALLRQRVGVTDRAPMATQTAPLPTALPAESVDAMTERALTHPMLQAAVARTEAAEQATRAARAQRLPGLTVGADWIVTGRTDIPGVEDSGKDAIAANVGLRIPLWQRAAAERVRAAHAMTDVYDAEQDAVRDRLVASLDGVLARLNDSARRVEIVEGTLLPQAEATYDSLLGSVAVGRGSIAQVLLTQRDLLELRVDAQKARADHARAWSALHDLVGPSLDSVPGTPND
jgi:cobalt-zinc-cadmium efflux system outer membrane protein